MKTDAFWKKSPVPQWLIDGLVRRWLYRSSLSAVVPTGFRKALFNRFVEAYRCYPNRPPSTIRVYRSMAIIAPDRAMNSSSPEELRDMYAVMSDEQKQEFLKLISPMSTAEAPFALSTGLDAIETKRFSEMVFDSLMWNFFPVMEQMARRLVREQPKLSDDEFDRVLHERASDCFEAYNREMAEVHAAQFKQDRDRKADPENVARNVEICNLRKADKKMWSQGRLAKKFGVTPRMIRLILAEKAKWRRLAAKNRTN